MASDGPDPSSAERAWDEAALGYDAYFGPRFAPYLGAAVGALLARRQQLPNGAVLVPCVGPGRELCPLARAFGARRIAASDLSKEMVSRARQRAAPYPNVSVERADASALSAPEGGAAAVLSVFGLQVLPDPAKVLPSWLQLLEPGGLAVVAYWPRDTEASGPFHSMRRVLRRAGLEDGCWENQLVPSAVSAGGRLLADLVLCFEIAHDDARSLWQALTHLGPLRGLILARGAPLVARLGEEFVADLPQGPLSHAPAARLLIIERGERG